MSDSLSQQVKFLMICVGGILVTLLGTYVLEHPAVRPPIIGASAVGIIALWAAQYGLHVAGKRHWFPSIRALIGIGVLAWLILLSGGSDSDIWPAFLLITVGTTTALKRKESIALYVMIATALTATHVSSASSLGAHDLATILSRICVVLVPAELYRLLYQIKEQHQVELTQALEREKRATNNLSRRNIELNLLNNVALTVNSTLDLDHVLTRVIELTNASLDNELGSVLLLDEKSGELVIRTLVGKGATSVDGLRFPRNKGIAGWVCEHGETTLVSDVQNDPHFYDQIDALSGFTTRSMLCVPLQSKQRTIGVIEAINKIAGHFGKEDQQLLEGLAAIAAPAIENALLHSELRQVNEAMIQRYDELKQTQTQLISAEKRAATVELAGATAHQLNQPLTVILCSLGLVRHTLPPDHEAAEDLNIIENAVDRASEIVRRIGSITEYRTQTYLDGIQIIDIDEASTLASNSSLSDE